MKSPLHYQITEYDCGPTSLLNAMEFLFEREEIPPTILRNIMLYCLDCFGPDGMSGKNGTSRTAMMFLSNWLNGYGEVRDFAISSRYLSGASVHFGPESLILDALRRGGAAVVRLDLEGEHYVLLTGIGEEPDDILLFDPYYEPEIPADPTGEVSVIRHRPFACNRMVKTSRLESTEQLRYAMGPREGRECVLLFNENTRITAEDTVEYFI